MAEAKLNFDENALDKSSGLYDLYSRFLSGMEGANNVDAPSAPLDTPLNEDGSINEEALNEQVAEYTRKVAEYSTIQIKNSAYMMANSIMSSLGNGGGGGDGSYSGFVSRAGDSMNGLLGALYGFQAGYNNQLILEITNNSDDKKIAHVYGNLIVDEHTTLSGRLNMSNDGVYFADHQTIFYEDNILKINSEKMQLTGIVDVVGEINVGNIFLNENGAFQKAVVVEGEGDEAIEVDVIYEYYHGGNSNRADVDWSMKNAHVYGNLMVDGDQEYKGRLKALGGFDLGEDNTILLYSGKNEATSQLYVQLATDLSLLTGYGIKFDDKYIVKVRGGNENIVSFSAPGKIMNLGDSDGETPTSYIALQTAIKNYSGDYSIITQYGDGNFKNSLSAGCANAGPTVLQTYYSGEDNCGVVFQRNIRLGNVHGPAINTGEEVSNIVMTIPYQHIVVKNEEYMQQTDHIPFTLQYKETTSLFKDQSLLWSASLHLDTDAEFFTFKKPVEAASFSIFSEKYKTRLIENTLFLDDGIFIEGVTDGLQITGNAYFGDNLSSLRFASGFAGYGWAIMQSELVGGYSATFDELTIRKKMRVYELEVQKISATNGAIWVSDSCSGDFVEEVF